MVTFDATCATLLGSNVTPLIVKSARLTILTAKFRLPNVPRPKVRLNCLAHLSSGALAIA